MRKWMGWILLLLLAGTALLLWLGLRADHRVGGSSPLKAIGTTTLERGAYLARMGDCMACHSAPGTPAYAGGRAIPTPFGVFYSPNITPDVETGLGRWTADDFWNALHDGRSRDGTLLYPVFPYTNYTRMTRDDSDALYDYLRSLPPVRQKSREHELKPIFRWRFLLVGWRALFFRAGVYENDPVQSDEWNRGAYLVQGLAHCSACHEARNALGGTQVTGNPAGGLVLNWYAPVLSAASEAGVQDWPTQDVIDLLSSGVSPQAAALGPMAEVVYESLQHGRAEDIRAMAVYLQSLPRTPTPQAASAPRVSAAEQIASRKRGAAIYSEHCAACHGEQGEGRSPAAPALAGNRAVTMNTAINPIRMLLYGGYPPGTLNNPRPFGMPPYAATLTPQQIADVLTYVRQSFGNQAGAVAAVEVERNATGPLW